MMETERPRLLSRRPTLAAVMPLPREEVTPPVTKMNFAIARATSAIGLGVGHITARKQGGHSGLLGRSFYCKWLSEDRHSHDMHRHASLLVPTASRSRGSAAPGVPSGRKSEMATAGSAAMVAPDRTARTFSTGDQVIPTTPPAGRTRLTGSEPSTRAIQTCVPSVVAT